MQKFKLVLVFLAGAITYLLASLFFSTPEKDPYLGEMSEEQVVNAAPAIQMYFYIKKYAKEYEIPEAYAFALAYHETRYQGPFHMSYDHRAVSPSGAVGPMQIMPQYAHKYAGRRVTPREMRDNIQLNVKVSMKILRDRYNDYGDWGLVFGAYNTGTPCVNGYARSILRKEYSWVKM